MIGILGSGFGLYGYLPAAASLSSSTILLPARYQKKFLLREELKEFYPKIQWLDSEQDVIEKSTTLILTRRPNDQCELLDTLLAQPRLHNIIFEKPFAPDPNKAMVMQKIIQKFSKKCSIGFIFRHLPWAISLKSALLNNLNSDQKSYQLRWHFMADHYKNKNFNWKHDHEQGGGVIRFYGIHLIALLAEFGYELVNFSEVFFDVDNIGLSKWEAQFKGVNLPNFKIEIDSQSSHKFFILKSNISEKPIFQSIDPFNSQLNKKTTSLIDPRCDYLREILLENQLQAEIWPNRLIDAISLWSKVEKITDIRKSI